MISATTVQRALFVSLLATCLMSTSATIANAQAATIRYVMKNGRVYDGNSLAEVWPRQRPLPKQWWMTNDAAPTAVGR